MAHFYVLLTLRYYGIHYAHRLLLQLRAKGFGGVEGRDSWRRKYKKLKILDCSSFRHFLLVQVKVTWVTTLLSSASTNTSQKKIPCSTLIHYQLWYQERRNGLIRGSRKRINSGFLAFQKVAVWDYVIRSRMNWLI